jgi:hypothetical protein
MSVQYIVIAAAFVTRAADYKSSASTPLEFEFVRKALANSISDKDRPKSSVWMMASRFALRWAMQ